MTPEDELELYEDLDMVLAELPRRMHDHLARALRRVVMSDAGAVYARWERDHGFHKNSV